MGYDILTKFYPSNKFRKKRENVHIFIQKKNSYIQILFFNTIEVELSFCFGMKIFLVLFFYLLFYCMLFFAL